MDFTRFVIAFMWMILVVRCVHADDEVEEIKKWMPRPHQDRKILQLVEKELLKLFGMKKKVNPREGLHIPDHIWNMFRKWNGELHDDTNEKINVVRMLHHDDKQFAHGHESILFNMKHIPNTEAIQKAELHLFKDTTKLSGDQPKAFLHAHVRKGSSQRVRRSLVNWRNLNATSSGWEKFDVTSVILEWMKHPTPDSKFTVEVIDGPNGLKMPSDSMNLYKAPGEMSTHEWERRRPFLVIESNEGNKKRSRRGLRGQRGNPESNRHGNTNRARKLHEKAKLEMCRRRSFYLDFAKIGWSKQIISPMGFDMFFCQGTCPKPLGPHMNTTNHAVIQNQVNNFEPTLVPPPCCVPSSLGDESFLYIDHENQIVMKTYCEIIVQGCGCR